VARIEAVVAFRFMSVATHFNDILMTKIPTPEKKETKMILAGGEIGSCLCRA